MAEALAAPQQTALESSKGLENQKLVSKSNNPVLRRALSLLILEQTDRDDHSECEGLAAILLPGC